jgi:predicted  nucleic acid-binding Zn-ribbon protein
MGSVKIIVELQNIDSQLMELEEILGDLPRKVEESIAEEQRTLSNIEDNKSRVKEIQLELNKMELRVKEDNDKINNLKDQLFQVTTNRQYDAIMSQIDHLKEQLDNDENIEIDLLEEKEKLDKDISEQEENVEKVSKDLVEKRENLEKLIEESAEQKTLWNKSETSLLKILNQML